MGTDAEGEFCFSRNEDVSHVYMWYSSLFASLLNFMILDFFVSLYFWTNCKTYLPSTFAGAALSRSLFISMLSSSCSGEKIRDHMRNIVPILLDQNVTINDKIRFFFFRLFAGVLTKTPSMIHSEFNKENTKVQKCAGSQYLSKTKRSFKFNRAGSSVCRSVK